MRKLLCILSIVGFSACTEPQYSCDPQIEDWVSQNLDKIKTLTRAEWLDINDIEYQRGAYVAFSSEQKVKLWVDKLSEVLELDWTKAEYTHIMQLKKKISDHSIWYQRDCPNSELDTKEVFMYKWLDYAANELCWSKQLIYAIAFTPERLASDKSLIHSKLIATPTIATRSETLPRCDCHNPESAQYFECDSESKDCKTGQCNTTTWRCGWLWTYECNGLCYTK